MGQNYFISTDCRITLGKSEAILIDLIRQEYIEILLEIGTILLANNYRCFNIIEKIIDPNSLSFLIENEYIYVVDEDIISIFNYKISKSFYVPSLFFKVYIEVNDVYKIPHLINYLMENTFCNNYSIKIKQKIEIQDFLNVFSLNNFFSIPTISLICSIENFNRDLIFKALSQNDFFESIIFEKMNDEICEIYQNCPIIITKDKFVEIKSVSESNFIINQKFFNLSLNFNNNFYKSMFIDSKGVIYSIKDGHKSFGKINEVDFNKLVLDTEFTFLWNVKKDKIIECKKCKFKYICLDPNIPIQINNKWHISHQCKFII